MKNVAVLGSTGSIGTNTLKVLRNNGERFHAIGLAAGRNVQRLAEQADEFRPSWVYAEGDVSSQQLPNDTQVLHTQDELCEVVAAKDVDIVLCAISGTAGLSFHERFSIFSASARLPRRISTSPIRYGVR